MKNFLPKHWSICSLNSLRKTRKWNVKLLNVTFFSRRHNTFSHKIIKSIFFIIHSISVSYIYVTILFMHYHYLTLKLHFYQTLFNSCIASNKRRGSVIRCGKNHTRSFSNLHESEISKHRQEDGQRLTNRRSRSELKVYLRNTRVY